MNSFSSYSDYSDVEIWNMFRAGNDKAYEYIYQLYAAELLSYGFHIAKDKAIAEDCLHDLFIYLFQHRARLGETSTIRYYLFKSIRRKIVETLEKQNKFYDQHRRLRTAEFVDSPEAEIVEEEIHAYRSRNLMLFIKDLPIRQQEALFLLYFSNLSYPEIASIMSLNIRTVYNHVHAALETLRKKMKRPELLKAFFLMLTLLLLNL